MANSANPEINKKIATSALGTLFIATVFFYLGDRYAETLVTYPGQIFDHLSDAFLSMWETIGDAPFTLDMTSNSLLFGGACFLIIWMIWLRYVAFIGNYRSGEESGSARWGTLKERQSCSSPVPTRSWMISTTPTPISATAISWISATGSVCIRTPSISSGI